MGAGSQSTESAAELVLQGKGLIAQKQYAAAVPVFERATQVGPDNWEAWHNLGYAQDMVRHWPEALVANKRALTLRPDNASAWNNQALAFINLGRNEAERHAK